MRANEATTDDKFWTELARAECPFVAFRDMFPMPPFYA